MVYQENPYTFKNVIRQASQFEELADEDLEDAIRLIDKIGSYNNYLTAIGFILSLNYKERHIPFVRQMLMRIEGKAALIEAEIERLYKEHVMLDEAFRRTEMEYKELKQKWEPKPIKGQSRFDVLEP